MEAYLTHRKPLHDMHIALVGNIASLGYLIGKELEKRGASIDYYFAGSTFTTSPPHQRVFELGKRRNIPFERTIKKVLVRTKPQLYDLEIRLSQPSLVKSKHSIMIFNGTELRNRTMQTERRCFVTTRDLLEYVPTDVDARFLPRCIDIDVFNSNIERPRRYNDNELIVGHFPTDRGIKGSSLVTSAVEVLRAKGINCKLISEVVPHSEMPRYLKGIDVLCDWFGHEAIYGIVSIEALAVGTPVVCHVNDKYYDYKEMMQWIESCSPEEESIAEAILRASGKKIDSTQICSLFSASKTADVLLDTLKEWQIVE